MKKILLLFLSLVFLTSYGQEHYPMYSDIWSVDCNGSHMTLTKDGKGFPLMGFSIVDYIDSEKIKSYFLQSLNEFRKDYGEGPVKESEYLNKLAQNYCKTLSTGPFKHDDLSKHGIQQTENISLTRFNMFSHLNKDYGDLNKVVADAYFDVFVHSSPHMSLLLSDNKWFGFGFVVIDNRFYTVIRASSDSSVK